MAHTMIISFPLKSEHKDEFVTLLRGALDETRAYAGNLHAELWQPEDDSNRVMVMERWESRESQAAYFGWRVETGMLDLVGPWMTGPADITWMEVG